MTIDRTLGISALVLAGGVGVSAWKFGLGKLTSPGAGSWPLLIALIMAVLGSVLVIRPDSERNKAPERPSNWKSFFIALISMALFVPALIPLGYPVAMWGILLVQLRWVEGRSWAMALAVATAAAALSFTVFRLLLRVPLPAGVIPIPPTW
jgi:putative tricarboxylic transport membrane protein